METTRQERMRKLAKLTGLAAAALVVTVPIAQLLVWSWQLHPLAVVPSYVLGIPLWLTVVAQSWAGVRRVQALVRGRSTAPQAVAETAATATVLVPAPRTETQAPRVLRTPTP